MATAGGRILVALLDAGVIGALVLADVLWRRWVRRSMPDGATSPSYPAPRPVVVDLTAAEARDAACRS